MAQKPKSALNVIKKN